MVVVVVVVLLLMVPLLLLIFLPSASEHLLGSEDVHEGNGSGDSLKGEHGGHGDHGGASLGVLNLLVASKLIGREPSLEVEGVNSEVTGRLGGLAAEVVSGVSDALSLSDDDESEDAGKDAGLLLSEDAGGLSPVRIVG